MREAREEAHRVSCLFDFWMKGRCWETNPRAGIVEKRGETFRHRFAHTHEGMTVSNQSVLQESNSGFLSLAGPSNQRNSSSVS